MERDCFIHDERRLDLSTVKALNLLIGSCAIESSIRRMVNLHLKAPCTFRYRENTRKCLYYDHIIKQGVGTA